MTAHILVEDVESDPAGRQGAAVLRELAEPADGGFGWGCNGTGPLRAAAAILADALSLGDPDRGTDPFPPWQDTTLTSLCGDSTWDVASQLCEEWRLRRAAGEMHGGQASGTPPRCGRVHTSAAARAIWGSGGGRHDPG